MATLKNEQLTDSILGLLKSKFNTPSGEVVVGESVSALSTFLRYDGWKGLGCNNDFEDTVEELGFKVIRGAKNYRNQSCSVVTI